MRRALWIAAATPVVWLVVGAVVVSGHMPGLGGHQMRGRAAPGQERSVVPAAATTTMRVVNVAFFRHGVDRWGAGAGSSVRHVARSDGALAVSRRRGRGRVGAMGPRLRALAGEELVATLRLRTVRGRAPLTVQLVADNRKGQPVQAQTHVELTRDWRDVAVLASPGTRPVRVRVLAGGPRRKGQIQIDTARVVGVTARPASTAGTAGTPGAPTTGAVSAPAASPADPVTQATPDTPAAPDAPVTPDTPVTQAAPETSSDTPAAPDAPAAPVTPDTPVTQAAPETSSDTPAVPDAPAAPETSSDTPAAPVTPVTPDAPVTQAAPETSSETPAAPDAPAAPAAPVTPEASSDTAAAPETPADPTTPVSPPSPATTPGSAALQATGGSVPAACQGLDFSQAGQGELDWADEFTGTSVDPSRWRVRNGESLSYDQARIQAGNVSVADGMLDIEARREDAAGRHYTTGYLDTIGTYARQWGRWEVRAKLPTVPGSSRGLWPAFWLRAEGSAGEIDVAEAWGEPTTRSGYRPGSYQWTVHQDTNSAPGAERRSGWGTPVGAPPVAADFHLYAVDWTPDCLVFSMDHKVVGTVLRTDATWMTSALAGPVDIRLNLQVGQNYWGLADPADGLLTALPASLLVDYVRVYRPLGVD